MPSADDLIERIKKGDRRSLARSITHIENRTKIGDELRHILGYVESSSHVIGITGSPGAGKSTLVDQLVLHFRQRSLTVGVLAVDPSSPFSNGAILGDRIRMLKSTRDQCVFIRSMATRGHLGGLSSVSYDVLNLYRLFGFDRIIVETVGAGQSEVDIMHFCDTTVVVSVPGFGDGIQALKAGILEIADIFVVNKADLSGAEQIANHIKNMLQLTGHSSKWVPPILLVSAIQGIGMEQLLEKLQLHLHYLKESEMYKVKIRKQIEVAILNELLEQLQIKYIHILKKNQTVDEVMSGHRSVAEVVRSLLRGESNE